MENSPIPQFLNAKLCLLLFSSRTLMNYQNFFWKKKLFITRLFTFTLRGSHKLECVRKAEFFLEGIIQSNFVPNSKQQCKINKNNFFLDHEGYETLPKAQRTKGLRSSYQSNFLRSYNKFKHKSWLHFIFRNSESESRLSIN